MDSGIVVLFTYPRCGVLPGSDCAGLNARKDRHGADVRRSGLFPVRQPDNLHQGRRPKPTSGVGASAVGDGAYWILSGLGMEGQANPQHPRVTIAKCDARGTVKGEAVQATASLLDPSHNDEVYRAITKRYGLMGRGFALFSKLRGGNKNNIGIELRTLDRLAQIGRLV